ncbi:furostanol glycoside 26-O-beta-glucosidase-like [Quercus robur]|uniref:furostanol glycoside 26-O-beta-glucosidase-like n=1 Tax=Quercus robur TaxID=38942 RepID=UPI0021613D81|nr:furostanol glycoside 26-O-beta-glucosidase-like [Quercus robur]
MTQIPIDDDEKAMTEGSPKEGGRGPSVYDVAMEKFPGRQILKDIGLNSYRFSISWSRILPKGTLSGGVNQEGIDHYSNLIDELLKNGIKPFVSLLHFDLPQGLEDKYMSLLCRSFIDDFKDYSKICFKNFGDRVKKWMTFNEPSGMAGRGYEFGIAPPFRCSYPAKPYMGGNSSTEPYIVGHNIILAHAAAVRLYREKYQVNHMSEFGMVLEASYFKPNTSSVEDKAAAQRSRDFLIGWYAEPLIFGDYPKSMGDLVKKRLPIFSEEEKKMIKGTMDFIGINYYTSTYAANAPPPKQYPSHSVDLLLTTNSTRNGVPIGPLAPGSGFVYIYPQVLQKLLENLKKRYQNPKIYITENATTSPAGSPAGSPSGSPKSSAIASPSGSPVGSPGPSGTGANAKSSAGSSIKLSISHLFFHTCAATVASTFTTY